MNALALRQAFGIEIDDRISETELIEIFLSLPLDQQNALAAAAARESFSEFCKQAWHVIDPRPLVWGWHLEAICKCLEAVARGELRRLIINLAPRHGKSNIFSILWPAWLWLHNPQDQHFFLSYASTLSVDHAVKSRSLLASNWYRESFDIDWGLKEDQNTKADFVNTCMGRRRSTSITGSIIGKGGDKVCIDDPLNAEETHSKAAREHANLIIDEVVSTRLNDQETGCVVMIMQRLHENDPTGHLLQTGQYEHLCFPEEYDPERKSIVHHVVKGERRVLFEDPRTEKGELLFPEKFSRETLASLRISLGETLYAAQFTQHPVPAGGAIFKRDWWRFWREDGAPPVAARPAGCRDEPARIRPEKFTQVIISVDANFKDKAGADPVAIGVWAELGADRFLLYRFNGPIGFSKSVSKIREIHGLIQKTYNVRIRQILVEAKANGDAIIETLKEELSGVVPVEPYGGKEARAWGVQPQVEAGNCYLPDGAAWLDEYITQLAMFPKGAHDDDVDQTSQALTHMQHGPETTMQKWARMSL